MKWLSACNQLIHTASFLGHRLISATKNTHLRTNFSHPITSSWKMNITLVFYALNYFFFYKLYALNCCPTITIKSRPKKPITIKIEPNNLQTQRILNCLKVWKKKSFINKSKQNIKKKLFFLFDQLWSWMMKVVEDDKDWVESEASVNYWNNSFLPKNGSNDYDMVRCARRFLISSTTVMTMNLMRKNGRRWTKWSHEGERTKEERQMKKRDWENQLLP